MLELGYFIENSSAQIATNIDSEKIAEYQEKMQFTFPPEYLDFVSKFGYLEYEGKVVLGISDINEESTYCMTTDIKEQIASFPENMIVIESYGIDNQFVVMDKDGIIYKFDLNGVKKLYESFDTYVICDVLQAETMEVGGCLVAVAEMIIEDYKYHKAWSDWLYKRFLKFYGGAMMMCYQFQRKEIDILANEIFIVEHSLLNNSLKTIQDIDAYTQKDFLLCYLDIALQLDKLEYAFIKKYLVYAVSYITPENEENKQLKEQIVLILNKDNEGEETKSMENNTVINPGEVENSTEKVENSTEKVEALVTETKVDSEMLDTLKLIMEKVNALQETFDEKIAEDEHKNKLFDNVHKELTKYQNGLLDKVVDSIAIDIIQLIDSTTRNIEIYTEKEANEENYKKLLRAVSGIAEDLQDILYRQDIEPYSVPGDDVDVRRQKIIQIIETEDQSLDNKVAQRTAVGYTKGEKIMRPERIKIYKTKK